MNEDFIDIIKDLLKTKFPKLNSYNIEILTNPYVSPNNKDLNSILNYEEIVSKIEKIAYLKHHELLEDLAENIFNMIFRNKLVKKISLISPLIPSTKAPVPFQNKPTKISV